MSQHIWPQGPSEDMLKVGLLILVILGLILLRLLLFR